MLAAPTKEPPARTSQAAHLLEEHSLLVFLPQFRDHAEVLERSRVAGDCAGCSKLSQQAPHDLSRASLWQHLREAQVVGPSQRADLLRNPLTQLLLQRFAGLVSLFERHESSNRLALQV